MDIISFIVNAISIIGMASIATVIIIGGYDRSKLFFAATIYTSCVWLFLQYMVQFFSLSGSIGLVLMQISSAVSFAMASLFYLFSRSYINKPVRLRTYIMISLFFILELVLNMSGFMIQEAWGDHAGIIINQSTNLYLVYIAIVGIIFLAAFYELLKFNISTKSKRDKSRNHLIIYGFLQAVVLLVISNTFFQSSAESQMVFPVSLFIMSATVGFAIVRYQLFDIKLAITRTAGYLLSLITLSAVYYGFAYVVSVIIFHSEVSSSVSLSPLNIILVLLLAFIFQPVKKFFDKVTNHIFYKDRYNTDDFFEKLNKILGFTTDLRGLLQHTASTIGATLKGEQAFFYINVDKDHFITAGTTDHKQLPKSDAEQLSDIIQNNNSVIVASLMEDDNPIKRLMISHRIELILPLIQDDKLLGYLCLGDHLTSNYTSRDIKVLNTISNELIIAIQNALAVQEIREFNVTLQQRIANATRELRASNAQLRHLDKAKDEFLSMASHQLRTPLTSVKGYISMIIDGDAGKVSNDQKKLLGEAFANSERMVSLINDFLSISRIQTGRFVIEKHPIDLSTVVDQEVNSLKQNASTKQIEFTYDKPASFPLIDIDEGKIRQVIMNYMDNAIYYSHPNTKINIGLVIEDNQAIFTVKDTGIGVPKAERDQLFTKFFRASNAKRARPDGSGVGLFLAKKVVDDHGGDIIFDSVEGKGSTFGFSLPIKPLVAASDTNDLNN